MVSLGTDFHGFSEGGSSNGEQHELLEGEFVSGMGTTVDDVECGGREDVGWLDASELGQVLVEGDTLLDSSGLSDSNADTENGVGPEFTLIRGTVELDEEVIDVLLGGDLEARLDQLRGDNVVDIGDGLGNAWAGVNGSRLGITSAGTCLFRHMNFYHHRVARRLHGYRWKHQMGPQHGSGLKHGLSDTPGNGSKTRVNGPFSVWTSTSTVGFPRESKI